VQQDGKNRNGFKLFWQLVTSDSFMLRIFFSGENSQPLSTSEMARMQFLE
jgi:hypothetical protein